MPLKPPPRDAQGLATPHDHDEVAADHGIIRRISVKQHTVVDAQGQRRLSTLAFEPSTDPYEGLSIDLEKSITDAGLDARSYVSDAKHQGSVRFTAGAVRDMGLKVGFDPIPNENEHHGEVWGASPRSKKKALLKAAAWFVQIPDVVIP